MLMIGHCGGLRNHQDIGDYVLATAYLRDDHVLDHALPTTRPGDPEPPAERYLLDALDRPAPRYRIGTVYTTANRNWELEIEVDGRTFEQSRAVAVDMESATIAANGFRYRIPTATLLASPTSRCTARRSCPTRRPGVLRREPPPHLEIALEAVDRVRRATRPGCRTPTSAPPTSPCSAGTDGQAGTGPGRPNDASVVRVGDYRNPYGGPKTGCAGPLR